MIWIHFVAFIMMWLRQPRWITSLHVNNMVRSFLRRPCGLSTLRRNENRMDRNEHESNSMIENTVRSFLMESCRIQPHSYVLLSVSGGVDSMAMLHIMAAIGHQSSNLPLDLAVVSFNHKLRPESDEEVAFVSSCAAKYGLPFYEHTLPEDQRNLVGLQARTREWRRKECLSILQAKKEKRLENITMRSLPDCVYATAHHADDQMETMMLKLLRGAFISNLQPVCIPDVVSLISIMLFDSYKFVCLLPFNHMYSSFIHFISSFHVFICLSINVIPDVTTE